MLNKRVVKSLIIKLVIVCFIIALDLITKHFFYLKDIQIIPFFISFRNAYGLNTGGAWGVFSQNVICLVIISLIFLVAVIIFDIFFKCENVLYLIAFSFIVGGTIGNLYDRIALGGVRDFMFFEFLPDFPTFNFADTFLCIAMLLLFIFVIFFYKPKEKGKTDGDFKS